MANSFTQIYLQIVFAVKYRLAIVQPEWENELYHYISGVVERRGHKLICINGMSDHIHILLGFHTTQSISDLVREIKISSTNWINDRNFCVGKFEWQSGYGAFSYSRSNLSEVIKYINNQKEHHKKRDFNQEFELILEKFNIEFDRKYLFKKI